METKFTKGEWQRDEFGNINKPGKTRDRILVNGVSLFMSGLESDREEAKANSDLFFAAPDLYTACVEQQKVINGLQSLLSFYRIGMRHKVKDLVAAGRANVVEKMTISALAKARGE